MDYENAVKHVTINRTSDNLIPFDRMKFSSIITLLEQKRTIELDNGAVLLIETIKPKW